MSIKTQMFVFFVAISLALFYASYVGDERKDTYLIIFWTFFVGYKVIQKIDEKIDETKNNS